VTVSSRVRACLIAMIVLLLAAPWCEGARKARYKQPQDVEATVVSLRRYEIGTYLEVMRDDGRYEWLEINREEGLEVKPDQRIVYSTRSELHEHKSFGMVRYGVDFRVLPPQHDEQIYRETSPDGTPVFTDNPKTIPAVKATETKKPGPKAARQKPEDEVIVVDQEELQKKEAMTEEYYRYLEQTRTSSDRPPRKAKRAKPRQQ